MLFLVISNGFISCQKSDDIMTNEPGSNLYFPPIETTANQWEIQSPERLNWDQDNLDNLFSFLETTETRAFILLKDGKIVMEEYWGKELLTAHDFSKDSKWYWASASKTIIASLIGIAQEENLLDIETPTSSYLGDGWSSLAPEKETLISVKHQLTMTTGFNYEVTNLTVQHLNV